MASGEDPKSDASGGYTTSTGGWLPPEELKYRSDMLAAMRFPPNATPDSYRAQITQFLEERNALYSDPVLNSDAVRTTLGEVDEQLDEQGANYVSYAGRTGPVAWAEDIADSEGVDRDANGS